MSRRDVWGFPQAWGEPLDLPAPPAGNATNREACLRCGFTYPFRGTPGQLAQVEGVLGGLCPACFHGHEPPLGAPGQEELRALVGPGWGRTGCRDQAGGKHRRPPKARPE